MSLGYFFKGAAVLRPACRGMFANREAERKPGGALEAPRQGGMENYPASGYLTPRDRLSKE
jgi:hypothetical protein